MDAPETNRRIRQENPQTWRKQRLARGLEVVSLFVMLVIVALRPLIAETYDSAGSPFSKAIDQLADPSPLRTLVFDVLILSSALGCAVARQIDRTTPYRRSGIEVGFAFLLIAGVVSCVSAGNRRLAINGTIDWLCLPVLAMTLAQLLDTPLRRRLLLAGVLASAAVQSFQCLDQYWSFDETWAHYQSMREDLWSRQNIPLDSSRVEAFERRMGAQEASGFFPHANVAASYLVLCALPAIGLALLRWRRALSPTDRLSSVGASILAVFLCVGVALTKSLGAVVAGAAGIACWVCLNLFHRRIATHPRRYLILGWSGLACAVIGVIAYGLTFDRLPGWSLTFRWQYWTASAQMIADHPWSGVGRENFGRHYLQYKSIQSPEEVSNPHNLFVQAAAEWGVPGLIGILLMLIGGSIQALRAVVIPDTPVPDSPLPRRVQTVLQLRWVSWIMTLVISLSLIRYFLLGTDDFDYLYYASTVTAILWTAAFLVLGFGSSGRAHPASESPFVVSGLAGALFAFLLHDMINFASFVPGTATTAFALFASLVAARSDSIEQTPSVHRKTIWLGPVLGVAAILLVLVVGVVPVYRVWFLTELARMKGQGPVLPESPDHSPWLFYRQAAAADPLDPEPCVEEASWLLKVMSLRGATPQAWNGGERALNEAIRRDPYHQSLRLKQMGFLVRRANALGRFEDRLRAVEAAEKALSLYPQNPEGLIALADRRKEAVEGILKQGTNGLDSPETVARAKRLIHDALSGYQAALELDQRRLWWEELHRLGERERQRIQDTINSLRTIRVTPSKITP